jgi:hypothetical protein
MKLFFVYGLFFAVRSSLFAFLYFSYTRWVKVLTLSLEKTWASKST